MFLAFLNRKCRSTFEHALIKSRLGLIVNTYVGRDTSARHAEQYSETGRAETMKKYLIVIEETSTGYSAYSPDLEGCVSTGHTRQEVEKNMQEAIAFHLDGLRLAVC
jgi:predicted RNase H-like HicB family nuclease